MNLHAERKKKRGSLLLAHLEKLTPLWQVPWRPALYPLSLDADRVPVRVSYQPKPAAWVDRVAAPKVCKLNA